MRELDQTNRGLTWLLTMGVLLVFIASLWAFGKDELTSGASWLARPPMAEREARRYAVTYDHGVFSPTNLRVRAGDTVEFRNASQRKLHIVSVLFDSGEIAPGGSFSHTFKKTDVIIYANADVPPEKGTITIRE